MEKLPSEILLHVFSFLPTRVLLLRVALVCRYFNSLLRDEWVWRQRFIWQCKSDPLTSIFSRSDSRSSLLALQGACSDVDFLSQVNDDNDSTMETITLQASSGGLDCVHLLDPGVSNTSMIVAGGARDQLIYLWRLRHPENNSESETEERRTLRSNTRTCLKGHMGWVWCMASQSSNQKVFCSGGWDGSVIAWDVVVGESIEKFHGKSRAAILGLDFSEPHMLISGGANKQVCSCDLRENNKKAFTQCGSHTGSVLAVAGSGNFIYSASEDCNIAVWDMRKPKIPIIKVEHDKSVTSLCLNKGFLSCTSGDKAYIYTTSRTGQLTLAKECPTNHSLALTAVYHNSGMLVTGSKDYTVEVFAMSQDQQSPIYSLEYHRADVCCIDFKYSTMAIASADRTVSLWKPNKSSNV